MISKLLLIFVEVKIRDSSSSVFISPTENSLLCDRVFSYSRAYQSRVLANQYDVVVVENIPSVLNVRKQHNEARRFITFVDELYEARTPLLITVNATEAEAAAAAESSPDQLLFIMNDHNDKKMRITNDEKEEDSIINESKDTLAIDEATVQGGGQPVGALASVRELSFAFERATSRLKEMTSRMWWDQYQ